MLCAITIAEKIILAIKKADLHVLENVTEGLQNQLLKAGGNAIGFAIYW